ncbi:hypothetical protein [Streptomyces cyaneofuscatus]|uniref:hypothetical protein n=1 Tax=Streptomyces cyaneofuscatus TaxID=66883 RepID=UPI0033B1294E
MTDQPDMDLHLRLEEHRIEGYIWVQGRRYRIMGIRDEEPLNDEGTADSTAARPN